MCIYICTIGCYSALRKTEVLHLLQHGGAIGDYAK